MVIYFFRKNYRKYKKRANLRLIDKTDTIKLINGQSKTPFQLNFRDYPNFTYKMSY